MGVYKSDSGTFFIVVVTCICLYLYILKRFLFPPLDTLDNGKKYTTKTFCERCFICLRFILNWRHILTVFEWQWVYHEYWLQIPLQWILINTYVQCLHMNLAFVSLLWGYQSQVVSDLHQISCNILSKYSWVLAIEIFINNLKGLLCRSLVNSVPNRLCSNHQSHCSWQDFNGTQT